MRLPVPDRTSAIARVTIIWLLLSLPNIAQFSSMSTPNNPGARPFDGVNAELAEVLRVNSN
jgi:hypothetical protein